MKERVKYMIFIGPVKQFLSVKLKLFYYPSFNHMFWMLKRTVSWRRFFGVPTTYVLVEK